MLNNISKQINTDLKMEQGKKDFYDLLHEDFEFNDFVDNKLLNLNENGVNNQMLKNEMPFLFIEDTEVDDELVTNLQNEVDFEDNFERKPIFDLDDTTDFQEPTDFDDDFSVSYASDVDVDTDFDKETDFSDNQDTPVDIDEFSNESAELLFEMGDIIGGFGLLDECDMTTPNVVDCPDEDDTIDQADEADVYDTEYPDMPEGVVMEGDESELPDDMDTDDMETDTSLEESFFSLFEDEDDDDEDDESEDADDDEDEDEDVDDEDDESEDEDEDEECDDDDCKDESFDFLGIF